MGKSREYELEAEQDNWECTIFTLKSGIFNLIIKVTFNVKNFDLNQQNLFPLTHLNWRIRLQNLRLHNSRCDNIAADATVSDLVLTTTWL